MKKLLLVIIIALISTLGFCQYTTVTGTAVKDKSGNLANGTIQLITNQEYGFASSSAACCLSAIPLKATVTNGAFSLTNVPDHASTKPSTQCFSATITDSNGNVVLGPDGYRCLQPTGTTWSFDTYQASVTLPTSANSQTVIPFKSVLALPPHPQIGERVRAVDCESTTACSTGGGSNKLDLAWNGTSWEVAGGGGGASSLATLTDSHIISPAKGDIISYVASTGKWTNGQPSNLSVLSSGNVVDLASLLSSNPCGSNVVRSGGTTYADTITSASFPTDCTLYVTYPVNTNSITPTSGTIAGASSISSIGANVQIKINKDSSGNYEVSSTGSGGTSTSIYGVHTPASDTVGGSGSGPYAFATTDTSIAANRLSNNSWIHITGWGTATNSSGANAFYSYRIVLNDGTNTVTQTFGATQTIANASTGAPWKVVADVNCKSGSANVLNVATVENGGTTVTTLMPSLGTQNYTFDCTKAITVSVAEIGTLASGATTSLSGLTVEAHP